MRACYSVLISCPLSLSKNSQNPHALDTPEEAVTLWGWAVGQKPRSRAIIREILKSPWLDPKMNMTQAQGSTGECAGPVCILGSLWYFGTMTNPSGDTQGQGASFDGVWTIVTRPTATPFRPQQGQKTTPRTFPLLLKPNHEEPL